MKPRLPLFALLAVLTTLVGLAPAALAARPPGGSRPTVFKVCHHGCRYRTIERALETAGAYGYRHGKAKVTVAIGPGRYVEGALLDGDEGHMRFDGMTIEGTKADRRRTILEGRNAGGAQDGVEAIDVDGLVLKNMWARGYAGDGFYVHASGEPGGHCAGYTMNNLLASGNGSSGLAAGSCLGGRMINSAGYHQGDSAFEVTGTPCDSPGWNVYGGGPCQARPRPTLLRDDLGYENVLGYSGPDAKYVRVIEDAFYDNGAGILADTTTGEGPAPNGWNYIEDDDVFWNNYDHFLSASAFHAGPGGFGELGGRSVDYPTGVGIMVGGGDGDIVRGNHVFGNYKWGIASFSDPGGSLVAEEDEAKNVDNEIVENVLGRDGADPNGEYDIWNDASGGGNCWGANGEATFAPGNGKVAPGQIYPICPQSKVAYASVGSLSPEAGLQGVTGEAADPRTILGYLGTDPPQDQQCSWVRHVATHPPFQEFEPAEVSPRPGELSCG